MSKIWFTADTHFGHANILKYTSRPFKDVAEMNEELISRWNARVQYNDAIYHLGDFSFLSSGETVKVLNRLSGNKFLVKGNHDRVSPEVASKFAWVKDYYELKAADNNITLCHFPFEVWNRSHKGAWHLHGHSHGRSSKRGGRLDVGVDVAWGQHHMLEPWSLDEVAEYMKANPNEVGHHR